MRNFLLFAILVLGFILSIDARAQFFWGNVNSKDAAVNLTNQIAHQNDSKTIEVGTTDPTSAPVNAATGSLYLNNTALFQKLDNGSSTNWIPFLNGPAGSGTDECLSRWDGTGVPLLQDSAVCVSDSGDVTGATSLIVDNFLLDGNTIAATGDMIVSATGELRLDTVSTSSAPYIDASGYLNSYQLTDGQLLIGSSGSVPVAASLTGTANQISIGNASGSITLSTPQNLDTAASVEFGNLQISAVSPSSAVITDASGFFQSSVTTSTEISYLNGVTSSVQNQLDGKLTENLTNTYIFIGDASGFAQENPVSGDLSLSNTGDAQIVAGSIVNADVNASAAIDTTKLEALTANTVGVLDASGFLSSDSDWTYNATTNVSSLTGQSNVDNTRLDGNTLSSTNSNGSLLLAPNGTGSVGLDFTGSQDYYLGWNANDTDALIIQGQSSATNATVDLFSTDGDNVNTSFRVIGSGLPSSMATNFEAVQFGWLDSAQKYRIFSGASGTGTARDFSIDVGSNLNALHVDSASGWVSVNGSSPSSELDVNGRFQVDSTTKPSRPMPEMTDAQRDAATASNGDFVANTDTNRPNFYNGTKWQEVALEDKTLDVFYADNFEVEFIDNYTSGSSAAFDGGGAIDGSINLETASPIARDNSINYTMNASSGSASDWFASPSITIANVSNEGKKEQGNYVGLTGWFRYDGADGDISIILWDDTNDTILDELEIETATNATPFQLLGYVPSTSSALKWGAYVNTHNSSKKLIIDDVQLSTNPISFKNISNDTDTEEYTPTFTGFGNVTGIEMTYSRIADKVLIQGEFISGNSTATEARVSLPNNITASSLLAANIRVGKWARNNSTATTTKSGEILVSGGESYLKFSVNHYTTATDPLEPRNGSDFVANGETISFSAIIPIQGWSATSENVLTPMDNVPVVGYERSTAQSMATGADTIIDFGTLTSGFTDHYGLVTTGASWKYTAISTGLYDVNVSAQLEDSADNISRYIAIWKNGSIYKIVQIKSPKDIDTDNNSNQLSGSITVPMNKGDYIDARLFQGSGGAINLTANANTNWIQIKRIDKNPIGAFPRDPECTLTVTGDNSFSQVFGVAVPYQTREGTWRLRFNAGGTNSSTSSITITFPNITFKSGTDQAVSGVGGGPTVATCLTNGNASTMSCVATSAVTAYRFSGDVALNSKPTISGCDF